MTWRIFMRNGNLLERKTWGTYIMNGTRLAKKNDLAMKVMVAFAIAKIVVLIINHKTQEGFVRCWYYLHCLRLEMLCSS